MIGDCKMKINGIIKAIEETMPEGSGNYFADGVRDIKDLLKTSRDILVHGRDENIKQKLIDDISQCLGEK